MKYEKSQKNKGFILVTVLILSLVLVILGITAAFINQIGYFSIAAETKYKIVENNAEWGLMKAVENLYLKAQSCSGNVSYTPSIGDPVQIKFFKAGNNCFIWSKAVYKNAKVVKIAVITIYSGNSVIKEPLIFTKMQVY